MARSLPSVLHTTPSTAALPSDQSRWIFQWQNGKLHLGGNCPVLATSNVLAKRGLIDNRCGSGATDAAKAIWRPTVLGEVHVLFAGVESYNVISHHFIFQ